MPMQTAASASETPAPLRDDFDTLVAFARELATITTLPELRRAVSGSLRPLLANRDISILRAAHGAWEAVVGPEDGAERIHHYVWTPLVADGKTIGMLGIGALAGRAPGGRVAQATTTLLATAARNIIALDNLRQDSVRDSLTGCFNRAHALETLEGNLRRATRTGFSVSIMMIDIDDFKDINDRFGHGPGDAALAAVAGQLHGMLRLSDLRCRLGGDEFLVILPDTTLEDAMRVAESVRHAIEKIVITSARGDVNFTVSIGVAAAACGEDVAMSEFVDRADVALYRAKQSGRNCVQASTSPSVRARQPNLRLAIARPAQQGRRPPSSAL